MKIRASIAAVAALGMVVAVGSSQVDAASKANAKVLMTGNCADGKMVEGTDDDDCQIMVTVTPKSKNTSAVLEVAYDEQDPEWEELDSGKTRGGRLIFDIPSTDEDDMWMDGVVLYRVRVKKTAGLSVAPMREYKVEYVSSENATEDDTTMSEEDKAFNDQMDQAQADNQKNIQQQQPNAAIYQQNGQNQGGMNGQQNGPMTQQQMQQMQQNQKNGQGGFDKAGVFNKACGSIGFPKDKCDLLVAAKSPKDAFAILGNQAEKWCAAVADAAGKKGSCDMVMPNVFPPIGPNNG